MEGRTYTNRIPPTHITVPYSSTPRAALDVAGLAGLVIPIAVTVGGLGTGVFVEYGALAVVNYVWLDATARLSRTPPSLLYKHVRVWPLIMFPPALMMPSIIAGSTSLNYWTVIATATYGVLLYCYTWLACVTLHWTVVCLLCFLCRKPARSGESESRINIDAENEDRSHSGALDTREDAQGSYAADPWVAAALADYWSVFRDGTSRGGKYALRRWTEEGHVIEASICAGSPTVAIRDLTVNRWGEVNRENPYSWETALAAAQEHRVGELILVCENEPSRYYGA